MRRSLASLALLAIVACSSLPDAGGGIVALEISSPDTLTVESVHPVAIGHADTLRARALNISGDSVAAAIYWRTPDTAFVTLDSVHGIIAGKTVGTARVQASVGTLVSDIITFAVQAADTTAGIRRRP
jgi:hypothetical protein